MTAKELESQLQSLLFKYDLRADIDCSTVFDEDDAYQIKMTLHQANDVLNKDPDKISDNFKRLLLKASTAVVDMNVRTLFKKRENIQEICYRFVINNYSSLNDLIYAMLMIEEPEAVSNKLGLPLEDLETLLKQDYETRVQLIRLTRNKFFSHGLSSFLASFPTMVGLCSTAWNVLSTKMTELSVTEEEQRDVMKHLWGQHTEFRKSLHENDFSGQSIDELESKGGAKYLEALSESERDEFKERYQLTERQLAVLDVLGIAKASNASIKAAGSSDGESERQHLMDLISKAMGDLTFIGKDCKVQPAMNGLDELCDILNWNKELLLTGKKVIPPTKCMLDQALRVLQLKPDDRQERHEELIARVNDGSALHGLCLGLDKKNWCFKANKRFLIKPDVCNLIESIESSACATKSFCFSNKSEARKFEETILELGMSAAETLAEQCESCFETNSDGTSKSVIIVCFRSYPMASFRFDGTRHLTMTRPARGSLENVRDSRSAAGFLRDYGSHLLTGPQHLGCMTCHSVEISLPTQETKANLRELAQTLLDKGVSEFLFVPNSTTTANMDCAISGTAVNATCTFEAKIRGPPIPQPNLYTEIIKHCNLKWSVLIERNVSQTNVYGIWNWIADNMPEMKQQCELLRKAWLKKAKECGSTIDMVMSELRNAEGDNSVELVEKTEQEMESLLAQLVRFDTDAVEGEKLLGTLRNFFASVRQYKQIADEEAGLSNPWVTYVSKNEEFKQFLTKFSQTYWNNNANRQSEDTFQLKESLNILRETLNDEQVSNTFKKALWVQDAKIKEMLNAAGTTAKSSAESQAFNKRLSQVTIENLVETLAAELEESVLTDASSLSTVQWRIGLLLKQVLQSDDTAGRRRNDIEDILVTNGWHDGNFDKKLTADALHSLVSSIESAMCKNVRDNTADDDKMEIDEEQPLKLISPITASSNETSRNITLMHGEVSKVGGNSGSNYQPTTAQYNIVCNVEKIVKFNPQDPIRKERANQSKKQKKKPFNDFLIDIPSERIYKNETVKRRQLIKRRLRHRMDLNRSINDAETQNQVGNPSAGANTDTVKGSHYGTICELIDEYDPNGICEIYHLLLESRYTVPLFNPLTGEHYLKLLREVSVSIAPSQPAIRLGDDVTVPRVVLISCRQPDESQAHEILRSVFHVNTLHANDIADETLIDQALTVDLGIGHVEQKRAATDGGSLAAVLLVHITGDYTSAMGFVRAFADVLIVEDTPSSNNGASSFCSFISEKGKNSLEHLIDVIRWTPGYGRFSTSQRDANLKYHGFSHLSIEAPNGDKLYNEMLSALHGTLTSLDQRNRKPVHNLDLLGTEITYPVQGIVPFDIEQLLQDNLKDVVQTRSSFLLQQNFRIQYKHEENKIENRNDDNEWKKAENEIEKCFIQRKNDAEKVAKLPLLTFFRQLLENRDPSVRVMAVRKFSHGISTRTEIELQQLQKEIDKYHKVVAGNVSKSRSEQELQAIKQKYVEAKQKYQDAMLHIEHLWREFSHMYVANPNNDTYRCLPRLAAQHLLDGFSIELLDGDANLLNLTWIHAVFNSLQSLIVQDKRKIFVLSVMGVQSSGKSTLLNTMFGIKMRTSVGQCTRGINMQLLPVEGRSEYDYVLVLDTEGTRSPDFYGMEGNEKRDNQMATLSILLADATIIVNPGENDAATKEILPIVLMAYQGSKLAEDNGGRLSSMMFFVYNRIDTTQKEKLTNIIRTLAESLQDAFKTVQEMGGSFTTTATNHQAATQGTSNCLFRHFTLDTSNSSSSDVRILGQNKRSYEPPANVPDPKYGQALIEFREHIHDRVTQARDGGVRWESRSPIRLSNYLDNIWKCICSADFTLRFADVLERTKFDQLEREYRSCEQQLASNYRSEFDKLHKSMLKDRSTAADITANAAIVNKRCDKFQQDLNASVNRNTVIELNEKVKQILSQKGRERWKLSYEQKWELFQSKQLDHWTRQIKYSFHTIFMFDSDVAKLKSDLRQCIREKASKIDPQTLKNVNQAVFKTEFDSMVKTFSDEAQKKYPPLSVKAAIDKVYSESPRIMGHKIEVFNFQAELNCKNVFHEHLSGLKIGSTSTEVPKQGFMKRALKWLSSKVSTNDEQQRSFSEQSYFLLFEKIHETIKNLVEGIECFDEGIVSVVIMRTDSILEEAFLGRTVEYTPRENAHIYARVAITHYLEQKHANWEKHNSVAARFKEKKNLDEMYDYFQLVFMGVTKINLFRFHLEKKFEELTEAFLAEMVCQTAQRVKEAKWLYEIKWTQTYMDRYLLELIDNESTRELIHYVSQPDKLFTHVLRRLIAQIANQELLSAGKDWDEFKNRVKNAVELATKKALSSKMNRAEIFANELRTRLVDTMRADVLAKRIDINLGGEYAALDNESDEEFRNACQENLERVIDYQHGFSSREDFLRQVSELVIKELRAENHPGAMPRCEASCPLCKSTCIREAGHDTKLLKHDAHHQPGGLAGMGYHKTRTLVKEICSSYEDERKFYEGDSDKVKYIFGDWCIVHTEWEKPHPTQEWPLRQYIFYHYHEDIAKHHNRLPCSNMPESYNKDLETIRTDLERGPIEF